ncbi:MAG TPA: tetratricopeptide repeat protein [Verrucomicrobiae bacterium]|jgi:tetratricopeptide (TPR) repeat protein|nr:tetratricopeptide repeat protein [Verrucomicrobiae bacterium]
MKAFHSILIAVLGGVLISGCTTTVKRPVATTAAPDADSQDENRVADEAADPVPVQLAKGNPEAYARYAAGVSYEKNSEEGQAFSEYDDAALADPANEELVIEVARHNLRDKEIGKALALLDKSAKRPDASAGLLSWLARAQLQAGHTNQALAASKLAIQRQPGELDGYESQVEVYFHSGQFSEAVKTLNRAARDVKSDPATLAALADLYAIYIRSQPKDADAKARAIAVLDRAAAVKFASDDLWQRLADTYSRLDQPKKAAEIYNRILAEYPEGSTMVDSLHEKLAGIYFQSEDKTNAMKQLQAIVRDNPTRYPRAWFFLGELAYEGNKPTEAIDDFENALHWDPTIEQAYYDLALAQLDLHRTDEAFRTLDQARAQFSKTFACEFYTGVVFSHVKNYSEAIRHFKEAEVIGLATAPSLLDQRFYFQFGAACERDKQYKSAEEYLQKCIDDQPDFAEALNYLGFMFADLGQQLPRARTLIEKAVKLDPKNGAYLDSLGWVFYKLNEPQQALPWLLKAEQYNPDPDPTILDHIGDVYQALHQTDKALAAWKKSLSLESNDDVKYKIDLYSGGS